MATQLIFKCFWRTHRHVLFLGPLVLLILISSDVSPGFQSQSELCFIDFFAGVNVMYMPSDLCLVLHLLIPWDPAFSQSLPPMHQQRLELARIWTGNHPIWRQKWYHCSLGSISGATPADLLAVSIIALTGRVHLPKATIQMRKIMTRALVVVDLNLRGWQMAYQRSTLITLKVNTDTEIETPCNENKSKTWILTQNLKHHESLVTLVLEHLNFYHPRMRVGNVFGRVCLSVCPCVCLCVCPSVRLCVCLFRL